MPLIKIRLPKAVSIPGHKRFYAGEYHVNPQLAAQLIEAGGQPVEPPKAKPKAKAKPVQPLSEPAADNVLALAAPAAQIPAS